MELIFANWLNSQKLNPAKYKNSYSWKLIPTKCSKFCQNVYQYQNNESQRSEFAKINSRQNAQNLYSRKLIPANINSRENLFPLKLIPIRYYHRFVMMVEAILIFDQSEPLSLAYQYYFFLQVSNIKISSVGASRINWTINSNSSPR